MRAHKTMASFQCRAFSIVFSYPAGYAVALQRCQNEGATLMEVKSEEESKQLKEFFQKKHSPRSGKYFWLGLKGLEGNNKKWLKRSCNSLLCKTQPIAF